PEPEDERVLTLIRLLDLLELQARVEESLEEEPERQMGGSDPDPDTGRSPDPGRLRVAADTAVPTRMELGQAALGVVDRMRADEARMDGEVDERRSRREH